MTEQTKRAVALAQLVVDATERLRKEPTPKRAAEWVTARADYALYAANGDYQARFNRLMKLAHDGKYCERVAELQRATTALVDRRRELIGEGTT